MFCRAMGFKHFLKSLKMKSSAEVQNIDREKYCHVSNVHVLQGKIKSAEQHSRYE